MSKNPIKKLYKRIRIWRFERKVAKSVRILDALDWEMKRQNWTRHERRVFWREYTRNHRFRSDTLSKLTPK